MGGIYTQPLRPLRGARPDLRAAALCRRPPLVHEGRRYDNYEYAVLVGFNGELKANMSN